MSYELCRTSDPAHHMTPDLEQLTGARSRGSVMVMETGHVSSFQFPVSSALLRSTVYTYETPTPYPGVLHAVHTVLQYLRWDPGDPWDPDSSRSHRVPA